MKYRWLLALIMLLPVLAFSQDLVMNNFDTAPADTNYWMFFDDVFGGKHYGVSDAAEEGKSFVNVTYVNDVVHEGAGAMRLDYGAHNIESWGGYAKLEHWHPDSMGVYNLAAYDSIEFWYYIETPVSTPNTITFRFNLHEVSNSPNGAKTYSVDDVEYYYSFHAILDNTTPGWNKISMPLKDGRTDATLDEWGGAAFNRTGWSGIAGNDQLDKDAIKGFSFEFSIGGAGEGNAETGVILIDRLAATGFSVQPIVFFNGKTMSSNMGGFTWGQSALIIEEDAGFTEGTAAIKWTQGDEWANGWTGAGWNIDPSIDMEAALATDSLKFKAKTDAFNQMRIQMESSLGNIGYTFTPTADGAWHQYSVGFDQFVFIDGATEFDSSAVTVLQFMSEGDAVAGNTIYIDDFWTGNPSIDVVPPAAPTGVNAVADAGFNQVIWVDVDGESGETYNVYASVNPITDVTAPGVDLIASGVAENIQSTVHYLYYPLEDKNLDYYYAVTCTDDFGNTSEDAGVSSSAVTNGAKGIGTISLDPPATFAADGDLSEWDASGIQPIVLDMDNAFVSPHATGVVDDDDDLSANVWLAIDDNFLYVAADVIDNSFNWGAGDWWTNDVMELFIGLYDRRGGKHMSFMDGAEPDHKIVMNADLLWEEKFAGDIFDSGTEGYYFSDLGGADYVIEAKIPLDSLAKGKADRFHPARGMRIPIEITFHDNDEGTWEGNLTTSALNNDNAHQTPSVWFETWIGDTTDTVTAVDEVINGTVRNFKLSQNYPNPFNPTTEIQYTVPKAAKIKLSVYNTLGQKVETLVDDTMVAGTYQVTFNASKLPSGIYIYKLESGGHTMIRKMILMK